MVAASLKAPAEAAGCSVSIIADAPQTIMAFETSKQLPFAFAKRHGVLIDGIEAGSVGVTHRPGVPVRILCELRRYFGLSLRLTCVSNEQFASLLTPAYENQPDMAARAMHDLGEGVDLSALAGELEEPGDLLENADDAPVIRLINAVLTQAIRENASDIHVESFEDRLAIRFRVDGVLREILQPHRALAPVLISRVKVMARLDIAEKRLPQDGRISVRVAGRPVDIRVSTLPTGHGERVVLRLLNKEEGRLDLGQLGMEAGCQSTLNRLIHAPHGIILVTGPTGSGKTTTLYAMLTQLNDRSRNIMTVEDPIEYYLDGIGQTQVNSKVDMTFARGLRAILRQDPDVVMVGEIRDVETARIAVQASLTGHLVLSTLHTNTAVGAVVRMRDMGVEPFLVASSLLGVLAQRLVRILCPDCKRPYSPTASECELLNCRVADVPTLYAPVGCPECRHQGFRGRLGIFELIALDGEFRKMVHDGVGEHLLEAYARQSTPSIYRDGVRRVLAGETSLDELLRVSEQNAA